MKGITGLICLTFLVLTGAFAQEGYEHLRSEKTVTIGGKTYFVHQVKRGQTLYSLSKAYQVEMQEIIGANPEIEKGLEANQTLFIPVPVVEATEPPFHQPDPLQTGEPSGEEPGGTGSVPFSTPWQNPCIPDPGSHKEVFNVVLMMHFYLNEADSINTSFPSAEAIDRYNSFRYIQFYEGFRIAVDSLEKLGLNLNLYVFDVDPAPYKTSSLLQRPEMAGMDLIIGMLFHRNFQLVASWARDHRIPIVSPVSEREAQVEGNPMVIKVRPSISSEGITLADYLSRAFPYAHNVIVRTNEPDVRAITDQAYANGRALGLDISIVDDSQLLKHLLPGAENVVIVVTHEKTFALDKLAQLNADTTGIRFTVFGLPRWDLMEGMDYEYLEKARTHILTPYFIDYNNPMVQRVVTLFNDAYKTEPDILAFQGFDMGWYFLNALRSYGREFYQCLREIRIKPIQTEFRFRNLEGDGWENHHWEILRYENYSLYRVE